MFLYNKLPYDPMLIENYNNYVKIWHDLINWKDYNTGDKRFVLFSIDSGTNRFHFSPGDYDFLSDNNPNAVLIEEIGFRMGLYPSSALSHLNGVISKIQEVNVSFYIHTYRAFVDTVHCLLKYKFVHYNSKNVPVPLSIRSCLDTILDQTEFSSKNADNLGYLKDLFDSSYDLGDGSGSLKIKLDLKLKPFENWVAIQRVKPKVINGVRHKFVEDKNAIILKDGEVEKEFIKVVYKCTYGKYPIEKIEEVGTKDSPIKRAADTTLNTMKDGASMGPPAVLLKKIVNCVESLLLRKGFLDKSTVKTKLWRICRNPICIGVTYFSMLLLAQSYEGSKIFSTCLVMANLALKKVSADASESISSELLDMVEAIITDVEKINF